MNELQTYLAAHLPQYLEELRSLVEVDSGSDNKAGVDRVGRWLGERLVSLGFGVECHPQPVLGDNILARLRGRGTKRILLLGHSDTVYPLGTAARHPWRPVGPKLLGPGVCDMKGGLLSGIYAVQALKASGFDGFGEIVYLCVSDEEISKRASLDLIRETARGTDAALTLECARANGDIVTSRKTVRRCTLEAFGRSAHAGVEPEKGRNAIVALARQLDALDRLNGLHPGVTVNVGVVEGGRQPNVVADHARADLDLRAWHDAEMTDLLAAITQHASAATVDGLRILFSAPDSAKVPAMERTPQVLALENIARRVASELGFAVNGAATGGGSDASIVAAEGTPVLDGLGPVGGLGHSPEEYILTESIVPRAALLAGMMREICRNGGG